MAKYKVVTDSGTYLVETESQQTQPLPRGWTPPGVEVKPYTMQDLKRDKVVPSFIPNPVEMATEGGPSVMGAIAGGVLSGGNPAGIALGSAAGESAKLGIRHLMDRNQPSAASPQGLIQTAIAGGMGAISPEAAGARYPLGAQAGRYGSIVPELMTKKRAQQILADQATKQAELAQGKKTIDTAVGKLHDVEKSHAEELGNLQSQYLQNQRVKPLEEAQQEILNQKSLESPRLHRERLEANQALSAAKSEGTQAAKTARQAAEDELNQEVSNFSDQVGREAKLTEIQNGSARAYTKAYQRYTAKAKELRNNLIDIFNNNVSEIPTGEKQHTGRMLPDGTPEVVEVTKSVPGAVDRTSVITPELRKLIETHGKALRLAQRENSPAAGALLEIANGDRVVSGETALNDIAALNEAGWGENAGASFIEPAQAVARKVATAYRKALEDSLDHMQGKEQASKLLRQIRSIYDKRSEVLVFGRGVETKATPVSANASKSISSGSDPAGLMNSPLELKAYLTTLDAGTRKAVQNRIAAKIAGNGFDDFAKNMASTDPETLSLTFTPDELMRANELVSGGKRKMIDVADQVMREQEAKIAQAQMKVAANRAQRQALGEEVVKARGLRTQIKDERAAIQQELAAAEADRRLGLATSLKNKRLEAATQKTEMQRVYENELATARQRLEDARAVKKRLLISLGAGATLAGLGAWRSPRELLTLIGR